MGWVASVGLHALAILILILISLQRPPQKEFVFVELMPLGQVVEGEDAEPEEESEQQPESSQQDTPPHEEDPAPEESVEPVEPEIAPVALNTPTPSPVRTATPKPTARATPKPARQPTARPTQRPTARPTARPTRRPTAPPRTTPRPTLAPLREVTRAPQPTAQQPRTTPRPAPSVTRAPAATPQRESTESIRQRLAQRVGRTGVSGSEQQGTSGAQNPANLGPEVAAFYGHVRNVYHRAWRQPVRESTGHSAILRIRVSRDGRVQQSVLISPSGNAAVDESVRRAARAVTRLGRNVPDALTGQTVEVSITFEY